MSLWTLIDGAGHVEGVEFAKGTEGTGGIGGAGIARCPSHIARGSTGSQGCKTANRRRNVRTPQPYLTLWQHLAW